MREWLDQHLLPGVQWQTSRVARVHQEPICWGDCVLVKKDDGEVEAGIVMLHAVSSLGEFVGEPIAVLEMWTFVDKGDGWSTWNTNMFSRRVAPSCTILAACIFAREAVAPGGMRLVTVLHPPRV